MESTDEGSTDEEVNKALTELGRVVMTLRPKGADKPQTKQAVLDMAVDVLTHLEKKVRDRNLNPPALPLNRESEISDDDLDEQEATEPYQVPQSGPFPPGFRDRTYASPLSPALRASRRPPALEKSPIWPALGASSMYPAFVPSTLSPALGASPALEASIRPPALETSPICPALGASPRPSALVASTLSPALGGSPRSPTNQNGSNPISYEDPK